MSVADSSIDQVLRAHSNGSSDRVSKPSPTQHHSSISSISSASGNSALNPRSCVTCRRRKVKCDKKHPCTNCTKARIECIFPAPGRAPRKARKPPDAELLDRLRKLEGMVKTLGGASAGDEQASTSENEKQEEIKQEQPVQTLDNGVKHGPENPDCPKGSVYLPPEDNSVAGLETRFGRLVVDEGRSRYINNSFWASLNNEVEDIKGLLLHDEDEEDDVPSPESYTSGDQGFLFGYSSTNVDMLSLHPPPEHFHKMWELFKENVDPLLKVLHIPTTEPKILAVMEHRDRIPRGMEALLFSIYYAVITSTSSQDCENMFGENKKALLARYRFALEQGLARANFLSTDEVVVLQAFVIFLICLRRNEDARIIWTLTGLVVRMAQTLGIHRDGTHFNLSPFEIEMRRRLWWQVCILDTRASEDHGCDPTIVEASFDTKLPLNVNDTDLYPEMKDFPQERTGCTEMTFCLVRYEVANVFRRIQYVPPGPVRCNRYLSSVSLEQKERWITEVHSKIEEKYLRDCDMTVPLFWVIATVSRLIMSKMWLMIYHPYQRLDGGASLPPETRDKLFVTSLENIEYSLLLETEERTQKWGWLFRTYVQWHAIAFLLTELCTRTNGELVARAWRAVEATAARRWEDLSSDQKKGCLWRPLRKLVARARAARESELAREQEELARTQQHAGFPDLSGQAPLGLDLFPQIAAAQAAPAFGLEGNISPGTTNVPLGMDFATSVPSPTVFMTPSGPRSLKFEPQGLDVLSPKSTSPQVLGGGNQQTQTQSQTYEPMTSLDWLLKTSPEPSDPLDQLPNGNSNGTSSGSGSGAVNTPNSTIHNQTINTGIASSLDTSGPPRNGSNASTMSPGLGDPDGMNWASWDDLVTQYGMDIEPSQGLQNDPASMEQLFAPVRNNNFRTWYGV